MDPIEHLAELLEAHDGDDRCGCLNEAVWALATSDEPTIILRVNESLSRCLAEHPAGHTLRTTITDELTNPETSS